MPEARERWPQVESAAPPASIKPPISKEESHCRAGGHCEPDNNPQASRNAPLITPRALIIRIGESVSSASRVPAGEDPKAIQVAGSARTIMLLAAARRSTCRALAAPAGLMCYLLRTKRKLVRR
jgi:hypothetical protein